MRKFSSERLYKLTKAIVIFVTLLLVLVAYLSYKDIYYFGDQYVKSMKTCDKQNPDILSVGWKACYDFLPTSYEKFEKESSNRVANSVFLTIFLPLIFFGGRLAYKYIFPKVKHG